MPTPHATATELRIFRPARSRPRRPKANGRPRSDSCPLARARDARIICLRDIFHTPVKAIAHHEGLSERAVYLILARSPRLTVYRPSHNTTPTGNGPSRAA